MQLKQILLNYKKIADIAAKEVQKEKKTASAADWVFLIGLSLMVSALLNGRSIS